ncbi:unnamed protein product [Cuscuta campestris]|uniref:Uncharacterized protein n=1 Tax=Cuscuta campestris TaxID=132261 RepID=A0A484N8I3_9ASTE|nr:unnamed protein product [Cuscuta campestris]
MDFDYAHFMVTEGCKAKEIPASSPSREAYRKQLAEIFNMNWRILAFKNKPPPPPLGWFSEGELFRLPGQTYKTPSPHSSDI